MDRSAPRPLQVLPLGVGDAFSRTSYAVSLLIFGGRTLCLVDCPDPIHKILHEQTTRPGPEVTARDVNHLVLTHLHGDHSSGLESLLFYRKFVAKAPPLALYALPEVAGALWPRRLAVSMESSELAVHNATVHFAEGDYYRAHEVDENRPFLVGDLGFELRRTKHSLPAFGLKVRFGGRTFGYSGDTVFDPDHIEFLASADLIFHDCGREPLHAPYEELLGLAPTLTDKMHLLHLSDEFDRRACRLKIVQAGRLYTV